ncbi:hypothetical protein JCM10135_03960 [Stetteria hydrogenophila]
MPEKGKVKVLIDMGKYINVRLEAPEAERLIREVSKILGYESQDASEALRYIRNFDEFYEFMRKKFQDHLAPPKSINDMIMGTVIVDSVKLEKEGGKRYVTVVFDRRVPLDAVKKALSNLGYEVEVERKEIV